jgi:Uncharacterized protein, homolog of Cu resistance protein CopC
VRGMRWAALLTVVLLLRAPALAEAHTALVSSTPAAGSRLASAPRQIRLVFSEPLEPTLARIELVKDGHLLMLSVGGDPHDVHALVASLGELSPGGYRIMWRVVSADGHPVSGAVDFAVGGAALPSPLSERDEVSTAWGPTLWRAPVVPALLRGLGVGALMALTGLLGFAAYARRRGEGTRPRSSRVAARLAIAAAALLVLHFVAWLANAAPNHQLTGDVFTEVAATHPGQVELWRTGLALLALWALLLARREPMALLFAAAALIVGGASGHSAAIVPMIAIPARVFHLLAGAAWLGGVLRLLTMDDSTHFTVEAERVSSVALGAVVLVALSGAVQTVLFLPSFIDLRHSAYGWLVCAKIAGLLALIAFGAHYRVRMLPRLATHGIVARFRGTLRYELLVMSLVVLLGGLLAYVPPPMHDSSMPMSSHHDMP